MDISGLAVVGTEHTERFRIAGCWENWNGGVLNVNARFGVSVESDYDGLITCKLEGDGRVCVGLAVGGDWSDLSRPCVVEEWDTIRLK